MNNLELFYNQLFHFVFTIKGIINRILRVSFFHYLEWKDFKEKIEKDKETQRIDDDGKQIY